MASNPARDSGDLFILVVALDPPTEFTVKEAKWQLFGAAAEVLGRSPKALLAEAVDLCLDTTIALATKKKRED